MSWRTRQAAVQTLSHGLWVVVSTRTRKLGGMSCAYAYNTVRFQTSATSTIRTTKSSLIEIGFFRDRLCYLHYVNVFPRHSWRATAVTDTVLGESTIRAVESRRAGKLVEVASHLCTVVSSRAAWTHWLACEVGVGPSWAGHWARTTLRTVMSWWAKSSLWAWKGKKTIRCGKLLRLRQLSPSFKSCDKP